MDPLDASHQPGAMPPPVEITETASIETFSITKTTSKTSTSTTAKTTASAETVETVETETSIKMSSSSTRKAP